jgi:ATP-dependent RNA helicase RhlB
LVRKIFKSIQKRIQTIVGNPPPKTKDTSSSPQKPEVLTTRPPRHRPKKNINRGKAKPVATRTDRGTAPKTRHKKPAPPPWDPSSFSVPLADGKLRFHDLDLPDEVMHAIFDLGFQYCTPIQSEILPSTLAGKDATGRAQTGTGKTAAFLISIFTTLLKTPRDNSSKKAGVRALILAPTRELAVQITEEAKALSAHTPFRTLAVFGGIDYEKQRRELRQHTIDVLVATPGRLLDYHRQGEVKLGSVEILVIDEADRMLDMGFVPDVRKIIHCTPQKSRRQTLLFSATLTPEVLRLASQWTRNPVQVEIEPEQVATDSVQQIVYITTTEDKAALLYSLVTQQKLERVIVFCNRRDETRRLTEFLQRYEVNCAMISGEIHQKKRMKTLEGFKSGNIRVLVATDVAGRGLHIEGVSHVINYTLPHDPEDYVHRIGRTGRAGATGTSISFACEEDSFYIPDIENYLGDPLQCIHPDEAWLTLPPPPPKKPSGPKSDDRPRSRNRRRRRPRSGGPNRNSPNKSASGNPHRGGNSRPPRKPRPSGNPEQKIS